MITPINTQIGYQHQVALTGFDRNSPRNLSIGRKPGIVGNVVFGLHRAWFELTGFGLQAAVTCHLWNARERKKEGIHLTLGRVSFGAGDPRPNSEIMRAVKLGHFEAYKCNYSSMEISFV